MPSLNGLINDKRKILVKFGEHKIEITYKPSAYNTKWSKRLQEDEESTTLESLAMSLSESIQSWDVTDDQGNPVEPTADILGDLGAGVCRALDAAIFNDMSPNRKTGRS